MMKISAILIIILIFVFGVSISNINAQDSIIIQGADTQRIDQVSPNPSLNTLLEQVADRVRTTSADRVQYIRFTTLPQPLENLLTSVEIRIRLKRAATSQVQYLVYPKDLLGDTQNPIVEDSSTTVSGSTVVISWKTNEFAYCSANYGLQPGIYTELMSDDGFEVDHQIQIAGLDESAQYYVQITCTDQSDNSTIQEEFSFGLDSLAPEISGVAHTIDEVTGSNGTTSATITWTTNEEATSEVYFGTSPESQDESATVDGYSQNHAVSLTNLSEGSTYYVQVISKDRNGNVSKSEEFNFIVDTTPPEISDISITDNGGTTTIALLVNESSTTVVEYGIQAGTYNKSESVESASGQQQVNFRNLLPNTTYYARVIVTDANGNRMTSDEFTFKTTEQLYLPIVNG